MDNGEIETAYNEYIESLYAPMKPQDVIMERKSIMDAVGKKVVGSRLTVNRLDREV